MLRLIRAVLKRNADWWDHWISWQLNTGLTSRILHRLLLSQYPFMAFETAKEAREVRQQILQDILAGNWTVVLAKLVPGDFQGEFPGDIKKRFPSRTNSPRESPGQTIRQLHTGYPWTHTYLHECYRRECEMVYESAMAMDAS